MRETPFGLALAASFGLILTLVSGAPAPLPRREPAQTVLPRPPYFATMVWSGARFRTTFAPDGTYQADRWRGTWQVSRGESGPVLHVRERISEDTPFFEWRAFMRADMMSGTLFGETGAALTFEIGGPADQ